MSDHCIWIVDCDVTLEEAPDCAARVMAWLEESGIALRAPNAEFAYSPATHCAGPEAASWVAWVEDRVPTGVVAEVGRRVFHSGGNGVDELVCPRCHAHHGSDDFDWTIAIDGWWQEGDDQLVCPACEQASSITDWQFLEMALGFGNLGFGFDGLGVDQKLTDAVARLLGHRVVLVHQKI